MSAVLAFTGHCTSFKSDLLCILTAIACAIICHNPVPTQVYLEVLAGRFIPSSSAARLEGSCITVHVPQPGPATFASPAKNTDVSSVFDIPKSWKFGKDGRCSASLAG